MATQTPGQNLAALSFPGQFPVTAPDIAVAGSDANPSAGGIVDMDDLASETTSELQNLLQDLTNRLTEMPGSNLDFGPNNSRGIGIMSYLNAPTTRLAGLAGRIDAEFEQDPRVTGSATTIATQADGSQIISTRLSTVAGVIGVAWGWSQAGIAPVPLP